MQITCNASTRNALSERASVLARQQYRRPCGDFHFRAFAGPAGSGSGLPISCRRGLGTAAYRAKREATTPLGDAWRCLRGGGYGLGEPHGSGPADDAPTLLRGKQLRSAFILRALAIERWIRGAVIALLGVAVLRFESTQVSLKELFDRDLASLKPFFDQINFNVSDSGTIRLIEKLLTAKHSTLNLIAGGLLFYGALQLVEGIGLWSLRRWGEYVAVVGTTLFFPFEVSETTEKVTVLRT